MRAPLLLILLARATALPSSTALLSNWPAAAAWAVKDPAAGLCSATDIIATDNGSPI